MRLAPRSREEASKMSRLSRRAFLKRSGLAAGGVTLLGLSACGPSSGSGAPAGSPAGPAASTGPTPSALEALEAKAKAEGTIMIYTLGTDIFATGFKKDYPWAT